MVSVFEGKGADLLFAIHDRSLVEPIGGNQGTAAVIGGASFRHQEFDAARRTAASGGTCAEICR
jgi:hypothetical protein